MLLADTNALQMRFAAGRGDLLKLDVVRVRVYLLIAVWLVMNGLVPLPSCRAVLFESTGDPAYNTSAPGGSLSGSGWQYEGQWNTDAGNFLAHAGGPDVFSRRQARRRRGG